MKISLQLLNAVLVVAVVVAQAKISPTRQVHLIPTLRRDLTPIAILHLDTTTIAILHLGPIPTPQAHTTTLRRDITPTHQAHITLIAILLQEITPTLAILHL